MRRPLAQLLLGGLYVTSTAAGPVRHSRGGPAAGPAETGVTTIVVAITVIANLIVTARVLGQLEIMTPARRHLTALLLLAASRGLAATGGTARPAVIGHTVA